MAKYILSTLAFSLILLDCSEKPEDEPIAWIVIPNEMQLQTQNYIEDKNS